MSIYSFPEPFEKEILSSNPLSKTSKSLTRPSVWVSNFRPQVCFWWLRGWWMGWWMIPSLKLTAKAPENKPFQKDHFISQPLIFRGELLVSGREAPRNLANGISPQKCCFGKGYFWRQLCVWLEVIWELTVLSLGLSPDFCYPRNHDILRGCSTRNQPILHGNLRRFPHEAQHIESSNHPSMIHTTPTIEGPFLLSKHETCNLSTYNVSLPFLLVTLVCPNSCKNFKHRIQTLHTKLQHVGCVLSASPSFWADF